MTEEEKYYFEKAWTQLGEEYILYPVMRLDGIQFNVYLFMIKQQDLKMINGLDLLGYLNHNENQTVEDIKKKVQLFKDIDRFKDDEQEFISFVEKAI